MTKYKICYPVYQDITDDVYEDIEETYTEDRIIEEYWPSWENNMTKKYGVGHELITKENCIEDWAVVNWAEKIKDVG